MVDYRKFKLNSDYKTDNTVWVDVEDISASGLYSINVSLPHGLPFMPLAFGLFSLDNGVTWLPIDHRVQDSTGFCQSDTSNVDVSLYDTSGYGFQGVVKIKVFAFAPSTYSGAVSAPTSLSNFKLNSDYGAAPLIAKGRQVVANIDSPQLMYSHNLGYLPMVMVWDEVNLGGRIVCQLHSTTRLVSSMYMVEKNYVGIDASDIYYYMYSPTPSTDIVAIHYRIYGWEV